MMFKIKRDEVLKNTTSNLNSQKAAKKNSPKRELSSSNDKGPTSSILFKSQSISALSKAQPVLKSMRVGSQQYSSNQRPNSKQNGMDLKQYYGPSVHYMKVDLSPNQTPTRTQQEMSRSGASTPLKQERLNVL